MAKKSTDRPSFTNQKQASKKVRRIIRTLEKEAAEKSAKRMKFEAKLSTKCSGGLVLELGIHKAGNGKATAPVYTVNGVEFQDRSQATYMAALQIVSY